MLDNKTYQRELIRMFDSLRKTHKGEDSCEGITNCKQCPFRNDEYTCRDLTAFDAFKIVEIVTKWSEEHPVHYYVSQLEYDILESIIKTIGSGFYFFECDSLLMVLRCYIGNGCERIF